MRIHAERIRELLKVYFIMGSPNCKVDPSSILKAAIEGGITLFQYREKGSLALSGKDKYKLAKSFQDICMSSSIPFVVNDDIELALSLNADGVHLGQEDESAETVRRKIGDKILGVSVHTIDEAKRAINHGADYLGIGPIFPTDTKPDAKKPRGFILIQQLKDSGIDIPIVGIGGINEVNASSVAAAGADGVSVISAISQSNTPQASA